MPEDLLILFARVLGIAGLMVLAANAVFGMLLARACPLRHGITRDQPWLLHFARPGTGASPQSPPTFQHPSKKPESIPYWEYHVYGVGR
jgi:hypothetical protein